MRKSLLALVLVLLGRSLAFADGSDVRAFYVETERAEAVSRYDHLEFDGRYFIKTSLDKGIYEIEVGEKLDSKFYAIRGTKYFMYFRYSESLYKYDEGLLKVTNSLDAAEYYPKKDASGIRNSMLRPHGQRLSGLTIIWKRMEGTSLRSNLRTEYSRLR